MDYCFAPLPDIGKNYFYCIYRRMWLGRPRTTLINEAGLMTVQEFLDYVKSAAALERPVGSFLIATHGNETGFIEMEIDDVSYERDADEKRIPGTTYKVLVTAGNNGTISIPNGLVTPRPEGSPEIAVFHIRGCNVGAALPFLQKFKAALGGNVRVSAPKVFDRNQAMDQGAFEYMGYGFKIIRRASLSRRQLVEAFRDGFRVDGADPQRFTFIDGSEVPDASWDRWIPKKNVGKGERSRPRGGRPFVRFGQQVEGRPGYPLHVLFRHNYPPFVARYAYTVEMEADPGTGIRNRDAKRAARLEVLTQALNDDPLFRPEPGNPFPEYKRYGYPSVQDFLDGYRWTPTWNPPSRERRSNLLFRGTRHVYVLIPPVTAPATGNLLFNYYPDSGNLAEVRENLSHLAVANPAEFQELFEVV